MFRRLFCCGNLNQTSVNKNYDVTSETNNERTITKNMSVQIPDTIINSNNNSDNDSDINISILDTRSLYDSNELLHSLLHKPIEWKDTIQFVPPINCGRVIKVYDGDTITIASKLPYTDSLLYRFSVRLNGIDCPEIKSKNDIEKECALITKKEVTDLILHKVVTLKNVQTEKYGRILADVYLDDLHLNKHMLDRRLAVAYDGGTKLSPNNWLDYHSKGIL